MKSKVSLRRYAFILAGTLLTLSYSCKKDSNSGSSGGNSTAIFNPASTYGTMTDQEDNTYKTIQIGTQVWMPKT